MTTGASTQILLDDYDCDYYNALIFIPIVLTFLLIYIPHLTIVGFKLRQAGLLLRLLDTNPATLLLLYHSNLLLVKCRQILTNTHDWNLNHCFTYICRMAIRTAAH